AALLGALAAGPALAGEVECRFESGTLVVPAVVAGIAGDYILDTGTAQSLLHETTAQAAGFADTAVTGDVTLTGLTATAAPLKVADLDIRTWNLPTPAAGVIGADVLKRWVVEVAYA